MWPVMGRTILQRYVMVTEVGLPDILIGTLAVVISFSWRTSWKYLMKCFILIAIKYIQLNY